MLGLSSMTARGDICKSKETRQSTTQGLAARQSPVATRIEPALAVSHNLGDVEIDIAPELARRDDLEAAITPTRWV